MYVRYIYLYIYVCVCVSSYSCVFFLLFVHGRKRRTNTMLK